MSERLTKFSRLIPSALFATGIVWTPIVSAQSTQPVQEEARLLNKLTCQPGQECETPPPESKKRGFDPQKRSFTFQPGNEQSRSEIERKVSAGKLPAADVEVTFDFNSDVVGPVARQALQPLGAVLNNPKLARDRFVLVGHTDAKGSDASNQALSERRAAAVKRHLVETFGIAPDRLDTYGRGRMVLKRPEDPLAAENRRVQVINQGAASAAAR